MTSTIPDWDGIHLGDLVTDIRYGTSAKSNNLGRGHPVLRIPNVMGGKIDVSDLRYIEGSYADLKRYRIEYADILLVRTNANPDYIGRCALIKGNNHEWLFASYLLRIQVDASRVLPEFLVRYLQGNEIRRRMRALAHTSAGNYNININDVRSLPILLPPLHEQKGIVEMLQCVDRYLTISAGIRKSCSNLKKGLMQRLLTRGIGHTKFKKTKIGGIPENWDLCRLVDKCKIPGEYGANTTAVDKNETYPRYVRITDIDESGILINNVWKSIPPDLARNYILRQGDILFARSGATVGKTYLYKERDGLCAFAGYLIRFHPDTSRLLPEFLFHFTHSDIFDRWVQRIARQTAQPNINAREYGDLLVPIPPVHEQETIVRVLNTIDDKMRLEAEYLRSSDNLKKGLMQVLLTGKVRVEV